MNIENFQNIDRISRTDFDDEDKAVLYVMELTGLTEREVNALSVKNFNQLCRKVEAAFLHKNRSLINGNPKSYIRANGTLYRLNYQLKKPPFNAGRYVEVATYQPNIIGNLHKIMASMATPVKFNWRKFRYVPVKIESWMHEQIANDMKQADFKHAYHAAVFFYAVLTNSMKVLQPYFLSEMEKTLTRETALQILTDLQKTMDGFIMPKWYRNLRISH